MKIFQGTETLKIPQTVRHSYMGSNAPSLPGPSTFLNTIYTFDIENKFFCGNVSDSVYA